MSKLFIAGEAIFFTGLVYFTGGPLWACIMTFVIVFEACAVSYNLVGVMHHNLTHVLRVLAPTTTEPSEG